MKFLWLLLAVPLVHAADPRLVYTKNFPGSEPAYVEITVERNGSVVYKEAPDDNNPISIQVDRADADTIFSLADKLDHFSHPLESPLKVAFMGTKTFRYEDGSAAKPPEVQFNYSTDANVQTLLDWFERVTETERDFIELERTVKYDKLGVQQALIQTQVSADSKRLVAPKQFLPLLDRVIKNESYMHMARERAATFAQQIRAQDPATAAGQ